MSRCKLTDDIVISRLKEWFGDKLDYSEIHYINRNNKMKLKCNRCGRTFYKSYDCLKLGSKVGCTFCALENQHKIFAKDKIIQQFRKVHGDFYDYSKMNYKGDTILVEIICPIHGSFWQKPGNHKQGYGCRECARIRQGKDKLTQKEFLKRIKRIHENKYDYSKIVYNGMNNKITLICPKHGEFKRKGTEILHAHKGCPKCGMESLRKIKIPWDEVLRRSRGIHGNKYTYESSTYKGVQEKMKIICPKHGEFFQKPACHYVGQGCPKCRRSTGEESISTKLLEMKITFQEQYKFKDCKDKSYLPFDFYLPDYNMCIEYDGIQHFEIVQEFGGLKGFEKTKKHDEIKNSYCKSKNIKLIRIPYTQFDEIGAILKNLF